MGSKKAEEKCLSWALKYANRANGRVRSIISLLEGIDVPRLECESPDFVKKVVVNRKEIIVGIEHFRVDQLSKKIHGNEVGSTGIVSEKEVEQVQNKIQNIGELTPDAFQESANDIARLMADHMERAIGCSYEHYMSSFAYSFGKHLRKTAKYRERLEQLKETMKVETKTIFLVEIHSDFNQLFLNDSDGNSYLSKQVKFCPMYEGLVKMLEGVKTTDVDYLVLCFVKTLHSEEAENFQIVPLKTGDIRSQLKQQHIKIYEYAGDDFAFCNFQDEKADLNVTPSVEKAEEGYRLRFKIQSKYLKPEYHIPLCYTAFFLACKYKKEKKNYATTHIVQLLMEVYYDYLLGWEWKLIDGSVRYRSPIFGRCDKVKIKKRTDEFEEKWRKGMSL